MDVSCNWNTKGVLLSPTTRTVQRSSSFNYIACKASTLEAQRVSTPNLYDVLSLESKNVGFDEIKKAYRTMARQYHPDVVPSSRKEESTKRFVELQQAYDTLSNPISRQKYDLGYGINGIGSENSETNFSSDVWEDQLAGLKLRSKDKKAKKKVVYM
ncbi:hypothetical protein ACHQM5_022403 [Ranunculus cassubicifolius]